ncbi:MAG TPA: biopolymer transporter ExbD [Ferruginibacter sp.]|jgi:biopolymer transport protein ExbD|nr:biopolymer transporter ExbD [Ferruginibacter sp.]TXH29454.1 MAG: biopolymer transporter ExbD [Cyclobacteriaceae bacterium]HMU71790.1 biopolymer transporter ExbD [Ferruginibacter sp.]HMW25011.1 biopolymer transporter ExbD [Ferruginibacter sp.]HMX36021.1 biopolymer transporter ExbD [Ferruginibacter sp.]
MSLRKRLRDTHNEVDAGPLNDVLFILLMFFLLISTLANPNVVKVSNPKGKSDTKVSQTIVVTVTKDQQVYIGTQHVNMLYIDSLIKKEVDQNRKFVDTPTVVMNIDTSAYYGQAFRIMEAAKRAKAKLAANIKP